MDQNWNYLDIMKVLWLLNHVYSMINIKPHVTVETVYCHLCCRSAGEAKSKMKELVIAKQEKCYRDCSDR